MRARARSAGFRLIGRVSKIAVMPRPAMTHARRNAIMLGEIGWKWSVADQAQALGNRLTTFFEFYRVRTAEDETDGDNYDAYST